jgi:hypothetical protein
MIECRLCGSRLFGAEDGTLIDESGDQACSAAVGNEPHEPSGEADELAGLAILDMTGVTDHVPGMPDVF